MKVGLTPVEAETILAALSRPAAEPISAFRAAVRARIKRKMRQILADADAGQDPDDVTTDGGSK